MTIGSLYVAIRMCISIVLSFIVTYCIITFAFAVGLHFILKHSTETCDDQGNLIHMSCNDASLVSHDRFVSVYCAAEEDKESVRTFCSDQCWKKWSQKPEDQTFWKPFCTATTEFGKVVEVTPKIVPDAKETKYVRGSTIKYN